MNPSMHQTPTISSPFEILFHDGYKMIHSDNADTRILGAIILKNLYECGEKLTELNKKHGIDNTGVERTMTMLHEIINNA